MKTVERLIKVGPFHIFKLRAVHKKEVGISDWRNKYADLKVDDSFGTDEEEGDDQHDDEETPAPEKRGGKGDRSMNKSVNSKK